MRAITWLACVLTSLSALAQAAPTFDTTEGKVIGTSLEGGVIAVLGVPYAAPPIGPARWRAPRAPAHRAQPLIADHFGPGCMQALTPPQGPWSQEFQASPPYDEDCLTLNIWTRANHAAADLPVLFWIHGGGLVQGSNSVPIYNGAALAKQGIVFVNINYRLGIPGFLALAALSAESPDHVSGNYGLQDDIAALKWVQQNIASFGGDPTRVTIAGQSGGARSVHALLFSPLAKGLFRGAIAESGIPWVIPSLSDSVPTLQQAQEQGTALTDALHLRALADLRALPSKRMIDPAAGELIGGERARVFRGGPNVDGFVLPQQPAEAINGPPLIDVPVLLGHNGDEGDVRRKLTDPIPLSEFEAHAREVYGSAAAAQILSLYPTHAGDAGPAWRASGHDRVMFGVYDWASRRVSHAHSAVYLYDFTHVMPGYTAKEWGSYHSSEIPYWTGNLERLAARPWTAEDRKISATMSEYWLNFIKTGDPNSSGLPEWRGSSTTAATVMELSDTPHMRPIGNPAVTAFFKKYYGTH